MAGEVTDGKKDRLVFPARFLEGLLAPRIPIDWIVRVQEEIGTFCVNEAVGVTVRGRAYLRAGVRSDVCLL